MSRQIVEFRTILNASADEVFAWHWKPGTLRKLIPPWETVDVERPAPGPEEGAIAVLHIRIGLLNIKWTARHCEIVPGRQFADVQMGGPFAFWHHLHNFSPLSDETCELIDRIEYELPLSALSQPFMGRFVEDKLKRMFEYRHAVTSAELNSFTSTLAPGC